MTRAFAILLVFCASAAAAAPDATEICRRLPITDARDGSAIVGPEDVLFDSANARFLVGAHDRRQRNPGAGERWSGGVFALPTNAINADAAALSRPFGERSDLRPHGIDHADGDLWVIHRPPRAPNADRTELTVVAADAEGEDFVLATPALCRANDVAILGEGVGADALVTLDHGACGGFPMFAEQARGQERGGLAAIDEGQVQVLRNDLFFPNGVVETTDRQGARWVAVAETRGSRVRWAQTASLIAGGDFTATTLLEDGPDNLNRLGDQAGRLLAVAHTSLFTTGMHLMLPARIAPSPSSALYLLAPPGADGVTPEAVLSLRIPGDLYAGATAAAYDGERSLVVGSATETGLLVCDWSPPPS